MRKCGSCRHFSDCGVAGSGNCLHDHRKHLFGIVLVRKTELACRNAFDQDLWEPVPHPYGSHGADGNLRAMPEADASNTLFVGGEEARPAPGLGLPSRMQLRGRAEDDDENTASAQTALQSQETGVISEHPGGAIVREARRRRKELHQQERLQEFEARTGVRLHDTSPPRSPGRQPDVATPSSAGAPTIDMTPRIDAGGALAPAASNNALPAPDISVEFAGRRVPDVAAHGVAAHDPSAARDVRPDAASPARAARHESAPSRDAVSQVRREVRAPRETPPLPSVPRRRPAAAQEQRQVQPNAQTQQPRAAGQQGNERRATNRRRAPQPTEQFDVVPPAEDRQTVRHAQDDATAPTGRAAAQSAQPSPAQRLAPLPVPPTRAASDAPRRQPVAPASADTSKPDERRLPLSATLHVEPPSEDPLALPRRRQASSDLATARPQDPIDTSPRCAGVPRCCATCVSFQRLEGTNRGRCHNVHVFTIPNVVDGDSLACQSSMGTWWLPAVGVAARHSETTSEANAGASRRRDG